MNEQLFHLGIKALVMNEKKQILLLEVNTSKFSDRSKKNIYYWDIPGGRVHEGGTIEETLKREVKEEIGVKNISIGERFDSFISNIRIPVDGEYAGLILFVYLCKIKDTRKELRLNEESKNYKWSSIDEAKKLLTYKYPESFIKNLDKLKQHKVG